MNSLHVVYSGTKKTVLGKCPKLGTIKVDGYKKPLTEKNLEEIKTTIADTTGYANINILDYFELGEDFEND